MEKPKLRMKLSRALGIGVTAAMACTMLPMAAVAAPHRYRQRAIACKNECAGDRVPADVEFDRQGMHEHLRP